MWPLFLQVDKDRSGQLSENELRRALVNGDYTAFDVHTVKMMIRMFDTDRSGTINFDEFCGLWGFLSAWRGLFDRFDVDRSGSITFCDRAARASMGTSPKSPHSTCVNTADILVLMLSCKPGWGRSWR